MSDQQELHDNQRLVVMAPVDVFKLALRKSGKTPQQVAKAMGWDTNQTNRMFSPEKYWPSFPQLPKLCHVLGNTILLDWLKLRTMHYGMDETRQDVDCKAVVLRLAKLFGEVGDVGSEVTAAVADGVLDIKEIRRIIRELQDLADEVPDFIADLRALERKKVEDAKRAVK